jgi:hypothetical protein
MVGPVIVRRRVNLDKLTTNNEVAGFKFAVIGVLYAVLLAFAVIVVWEKFNDAEKFVAQEVGGAAALYRLPGESEPSQEPRFAKRPPSISRLPLPWTGPPWNGAKQVPA